MVKGFAAMECRCSRSEFRVSLPWNAGVAVATVDKLGRRPLLLAGVSGLVLSLLALGGAQYIEKGSVATWTSVVGLLAYTACYQVR